MNNRIIAGRVDQDGNVYDAQGVDVMFEPNGYRMMFYDLPEAPVVVCQAWPPPHEAITFVTRGIMGNEVLVQALNSHGDMVQSPFVFIAVSNY